MASVAVGRGQVERPDLDGAERAGQPGLQEGLPAAGEADAHGLGRVGDRLVADPLEGPDGRDVERVLERLADEDRAALQPVGVARRPVLAAIEVVVTSSSRLPGRQRAGFEGGRVEDRLERRAGLAGAVAGDVVLGLELRAGQVVAVVAGAAGVGQHVAGPVVEGDERPVVQVLAAQGPDPAPGRAGDLERLEQASPFLRGRFGTMAPAVSHFSASCWACQSSVVMTL